MDPLTTDSLFALSSVDCNLPEALPKTLVRQSVKGMGQGLVAKADIPERTLVLAEKPLLYIRGTDSESKTANELKVDE